MREKKTASILGNPKQQKSFRNLKMRKKFNEVTQSPLWTWIVASFRGLKRQLSDPEQFRAAEDGSAISGIEDAASRDARWPRMGLLGPRVGLLNISNILIPSTKRLGASADAALQPKVIAIHFGGNLHQVTRILRRPSSQKDAFGGICQRIATQNIIRFFASNHGIFSILEGTVVRKILIDFIESD